MLASLPALDRARIDAQRDGHSLWVSPRARRAAMNRSGREAAGTAGSHRRKEMMAGMYWTSGWDALLSQLVMVCS